MEHNVKDAKNRIEELAGLKTGLHEGDFLLTRFAERAATLRHVIEQARRRRVD
jgi:hypothetical protein